MTNQNHSDALNLPIKADVAPCEDGHLKTWPERIWLQHGDLPEVPPFSEVYAADAVTWCIDKIEDADVEYVRADVYAALTAEIERLKKELAIAQVGDFAGQAGQEHLSALIDELRPHAERYRYLRNRPLNSIQAGGIFVGKTPDNTVLTGEDLDAEVDASIQADTDCLVQILFDAISNAKEETP